MIVVIIIESDAFIYINPNDPYMKDVEMGFECERGKA